MREEHLRSAVARRSEAALPLSAWRGRSGRRYVVGVHDADRFEAEEMQEAVVIAVRRDTAGLAELVSIASSSEGPRAHLRRVWLDRVRKDGATEMHVHRLDGDAGTGPAIADDLGPWR